MARVFVCYSRRDNEFVAQLVGDLRAAGVPTWRDLDDIPKDIASNTSGWRDAVDRGLRNSTHMLVILSPESVASQEVKAEWNYFLAQGRTVYPVVYRDCEIPYRLYALNYFDFRQDYEVGLAGLLKGLPKGEEDAIEHAPRRSVTPQSVIVVSGAVILAAVLIGIALVSGGLQALMPKPSETSAFTTTPTAGPQAVSITENSTEAASPEAALDPLVITAGNLAKLSLLSTLTGHTDSVRAVVWSPDGTRLASASRDKTVILWNIPSGEKTTLSNHSDWVNDVAWLPSSGAGDPGGGKLISAGADHRIVEWDTTNGRKLRTLAEQDSAVLSVAWSPDGKLIASGAEDNTAIIRNAASTLIVRTLNIDAPVYSVAWSPDSATLATSGPNGTILLWNAQTGEQTGKLEGHTDAVFSLAWSNVSLLLASGSADKTAAVWNIQTGQRVVPLIGHIEAVYSVAWSPDGKLIATASQDRGLIIWDAATGAPLRRIVGHTDPVTSVAWSPDGKVIATGSWDTTIALWAIGK